MCAIPRLLLAGFALVSVAACGGDESPAEFRIAAIDPVGLGVPQELDAPLTVRFNRPVSQDSVSTSSVFLWHVIGFIPTDLSYEAATLTLTIQPTVPLLPGSGYALVLRGDLESFDGLALGEDVVQTFETVDRRAWQATETVVSGHDRVAQLSIDAVGGYHLLAGEPTALGTWRYFRRESAGSWMPAEILPSTDAAPVGFELAFDGSIRGAVAFGIPGSTLRREGAQWQPPEAISIEPRPTLPAGAPWPDPQLYTWVPGGRVSSAFRLGPRVGSLCRLVTATGDVPCPYDEATEDVWTAILGPGNADVVVGARNAAPREVWAWIPGAEQRDYAGAYPAGETLWSTALGSSAFGEVAVAYMTGDRLPSGPGSGPFEIKVRTARFDPFTGWIPADQTLAVRATREATPFMEASASPTGDALVGWSLDAGAERGRVLEIAHFVALDDPAGWATIEIADHVAAGSNAFAVAQDPSGHAFVTWVESAFGLRKLWLRRFRPGLGWGEPELVVESRTDTIGDLHLATGIDGRAMLIWNQRDAILARRFE